MNWDAIEAVGEILGALAVLVTMFYLAVQIKQNTSAVATATYENTMTGFNDINVVVAGDTALVDIYVSSGGVFDSAVPVMGPPVQDGTMQLKFSDCNAGVVTYEATLIDTLRSRRWAISTRLSRRKLSMFPFNKAQTRGCVM